ncbi:MAG: RNA methyltransferase [Bacteroidales bacterium]|nr:RNA methyltransferase [Bacteroidales bacterium]
MPSELITSAQNPKVKRLLALQKDSSLRRESGLFVVEGRRELEHCMAAGFEPDTVFVCPDLYGPGDTVPRNVAPLIPPPALRSWAPPVHAATGGHGSGAQVSGSQKSYRVIEVSREVYDKVAYRGGTEGVIAEMKARERRLDDLDLPGNPLIMVLEAVEKPGNLGAVLRSADAAGADAVIICDPLTDLYNPNLIRASIGAVFTVPVAVCSSAEAIEWLKSRGIRILTAQLQDSSLYYDCDMRSGTALVMGTESTGLTQQWREAADAHIRIPMLGALDSLNVSVSAAILLFEAVRQRQ